MFIKHVLSNTKSVRDSHQRPGYTWSYYISKQMGTYNLWYDMDDWAKVAQFTSLINVAIMLVSPILWTFVVMELIHSYSDLEISRVAERISLTMGGCLTTYHFFKFYRSRRALTNIIRMLGEKIHGIYNSDARNEEICNRISELFVQEGIVFVIAATAGCASIVLSQGIVPLVTGELAYDTKLPLNKTSYGVQWWIEYFFQIGTVLIAIYFYTFKETLMFDVYIQLSLLYEKITLDFGHLCQEEPHNVDKEYQRLREIVKEAQEVDEIGDRMQNFMSVYMFLWNFSTTLMLGISGFSFIVEIKHGVLQAIVKNISYPMYVLCVQFGWCAISEFYAKSVREAGLAAFHCNWTGTPRRFRILLLIYLTKSTRETYIEGLSFYVVKMETMADILKKTYYFMALLRDILN